MHRVRRRHVEADLVPHALLCRRQRERQALPEARRQRPARLHRDAARPGRARAEDGEPELEQQEVVEDEPPQGALALRLGRGKVRAPHRLPQRREPASRPHRLGQRLLDLAPELLEDLPHQPPQRPLRQPFRRRVDGHQPAGVQVLVLAALDQLPVLRGDRELVAVAAHLAVQHQPLAPRQHPREIVPAREQRGRRVPALVPQQQRQRRPPPARRRRADAGDDARAGHRLAGAERAERREARPVLVPDGDEEERVADGLEPLAREQLRPLGADALEVLQRRAEPRRGARLPAHGHYVIKFPRLVGWKPILKES